jgi:two-component system, NarL family, sensor kinase
MPLKLRAQMTQIDSLKHRIAIANSPAEKLDALFAFCDAWESLNPDTLHNYVLFAKRLAVSQKDHDATDQGDYYLAAYLFQKNKLDAALLAIDHLIARFDSTGTYNTTYVKCFFLRGNILFRTLKYDEVLKQDLAMLPKAEEHNDTIGMIRFSTGIGAVNMLLKKYDESLKWQFKALGLMNTERLKSTCSFVFINIAAVYDHLAQLHPSRENEDSVEVNLQKAIAYSRKGKSLTNLANGLGMYGYVLAAHNKLKPAENALTEGLEIRKKIGDIFYIISDLISLAIFYENNNNPDKAIELCTQALDLANKNEAAAISVSDIYNVLGDVYLKREDYKNYSSILNKKITLLDSMYQENSATAVAEMETKYNVQKEENTILQQKYRITKRDYIIYTLSATGLLLAIIFFMVQKNRKQKQQQRIKEILMENEIKTQRAIESAKEEERRRIIADLHDDVGGGLSTIRMVSDLIVEQSEQTLRLEEYASKISGITKDVSERMNTIVWALNTDNDTLQNLSEYIKQYGFAFFENSSIDFKSNLIEEAADVQLSGLQRKNIFLCVKESLHNIYKHSGATHATVTIDLSGNLLRVTIGDDGSGMTGENLFGNGLKNIQRRMKEINGQAVFTNNTGTDVMLEVTINNILS